MKIPFRTDSAIGVQQSFSSDSAYTTYTGTTPQNGDFYFSTSGVYRYYFGGSWFNLTPSSSGDVSGPGTTIQYAISTWNNTSGTLLGEDVVTLQSGAFGTPANSVADSSSGTGLSIAAGAKTAGTGAGGGLTFTAGESTGGTGGAINVTAGNTFSTTLGGSGGAINITAGSSSDSTGGAGGSVFITAGSNSASSTGGPGGNLNLSSGSSTSGTGGNLNLIAAVGSTNGVITFNTANTLWATLDAGGNLTGLTSLSAGVLSGSTGLGIGGTLPTGSTLAEFTSTTQGMLFPRMTTTQRNAISSPANSLFIFNTTSNEFEWWNATDTTWASVGSGGGSGVTSLNSLTGALSLVAGTGITITPSGSNITIAATGGGSGTVTSVSVVSANGFAGTVATSTSTPAITLETTVTGILYGNGTAVAAAIASNFPVLNQNTTGTAANVTATSNSTLTTLSALSLPTSQLSGQVTLAQLPNIGSDTILGNNTGSTATPTALTVAQVNAILPVFTSSLNGLTPLSGGGTTNFLRADGTWATPSGSSYTFADSLVNTSGTVTLVNDSASPGDSKYYGTNSGGTLGYYSLPSSGAAWVKYTFAYSAFSTAGNTNTQTVIALAAKTVVTGVIVKHSTAFAGGSLTAYTVQVTDGASWSYSAGTFDVFQSVSDAAYQSVQQQHPVGFASGGTIYITATSTGDTLNDATAGSVDVWVKTETLP